MCQQCLTHAITLVQDVIPGFNLMQAQTSSEHWKKGEYALVECNDPAIVFAGPLLRDPTAGLTDEEINALPESEDAKWNAYRDAVTALGQALKVEALVGYRLVSACVKEGYDPEEGGLLQYWLMHHLADQVGVPETRFNAKLLVELRRLTERNCHGEAYLRATQALGLTKVAEKFERINRRHAELGYLSHELQAERRLAYQQMLTFAKAKLSPDDYQTLYMSF